MFVLGNELVGRSKRALVGTTMQVIVLVLLTFGPNDSVFLFQASFALGIVLFALLGFMIQDWRSLTLTISFIGFPFISFHWLLPESPRWLLAQDRQSEAIKVLLNR